MATVTIRYNSRNKIISKLLEAIALLGADIEHSKAKSSIEKSLDDIKCGRIHEAKDAKDLFKQCGINV